MALNLTIEQGAGLVAILGGAGTGILFVVRWIRRRLEVFFSQFALASKVESLEADMAGQIAASTSELADQIRAMDDANQREHQQVQRDLGGVNASLAALSSRVDHIRESMPSKDEQNRIASMMEQVFVHNLGRKPQ